VKLRGRSHTSDRRRGRTLSPAARGTNQTAHHGTVQRLSGSTSAFRSPECNILETRQSLRIRHHAMLHIKVPGCWEIRNDFCGRAGATFFNRRIRWPVILKSDANELRTRIQLNRCLAELRVHRSKQCALERQEELRTIWNGVHVCLTAKLRGRAEPPDGAEGAQFLSARDAKPQAHHGPFQRLLGDAARVMTSTQANHGSLQ
jgi:hypothetical protein